MQFLCCHGVFPTSVEMPIKPLNISFHCLLLESSNIHNPILHPYIPAVQQVLRQAETNQNLLSFNDRTIYNWCFTARKVFSWNKPTLLLHDDALLATPIYIFQERKQEALYKFHEEHCWFVPYFFKSSCYRFTLHVPCFPWATDVCGSLQCHICIV